MGWSRTSKHGHLPFGIWCLYAAELANGVVKVGLTRNPRGRIPTLHSHARIQFGAEVVRHELSQPFPKDNQHLLWGAERELLSGLRRIAREDGDHGEYFHGLGFTVAIVLMEQVALRFLASRARTAPAADLVPRIDARFDSLDLHGLKHAQPSHSTPLN